MVDDASVRAVYYATLDNLITTLFKQMHQPPTHLVDAYVELVKESMNLGQNLAYPLPLLGPVPNLG